MTETSNTVTPGPTVWHCLSYRDAQVGIEFLEAVGFVVACAYTDENDSTVVHHAELRWPPGGGIMLGSSGNRSDGMVDATGCASAYCVTESDQDVDVAFDRAVAAGARAIRKPEDQDYGGRACVVLDPEGNQWSFGSYRGE